MIPETLDSHWYSKLMKSLGNFNHSASVKLHCDHHEVIVIPKDMRENLNPPLLATNGFRVNIHNLVRHSVVDVLDSLLWISPQLDTLSLDYGGKTLKFIYRDAAVEVGKPCCASLPRKCWRHKGRQSQIKEL